MSATEEEEHRGAEGEESGQRARHRDGNPESGKTGKQEKQDHAPGGNCGWHFHDTLLVLA